MLTIDQRPCRIGVSAACRRELHGEEPVPAIDLPLTGIHLDRAELNALLGDKHAWDALYVERNGKPAQPLFAKSLKPFALTGKFQGSSVALYVGLKAELVALAGVKLSKLKLEPQIGGLTALSLTVQATPDMQHAAHLLNFLDNAAAVALEIGDPEDEDAGDEEQDELALDHSRVGRTRVKHVKINLAQRKRKPKPSDGATVK